MWGTDGVRVFTVDDGWGWIFTAIEHWNAECVGCQYAHIPKSRTAYWKEKFARNVARDRRNEDALQALGWRVLVIWECEVGDREKVKQRLAAFIRHRDPIYVVDRGYVDFARLYVLHQAGAFFVTRAKSNIDAHRVYSAPTDRSTGIICDQTISLDGFYTRQDYPELLRRIRFKDPESGKTLVFITNNFSLPAATICALYKSRWQVELFFKWIKQHLPIKQFYGTSENAVKTQIWIAVSVYVLVAIVKKRLDLDASLYTLLQILYVLVAIVKKRLDLDASLYTLLQILSVTLFEKMPIHQVLAGDENRCNASQITNQLNLFDF